MRYLIIGGAGFIGANFAFKLLSEGEDVVILDNFSKKGSKINSSWLKQNFPSIKILNIDIRDQGKMINTIKEGFDAIFHLAGQTAVTTSIEKPFEDFDINCVSTLNLLEAIRLRSPSTILVYSSTNKVYGSLENLEIAETETRYSLLNKKGIDEGNSLNFYTPYGCSKGSSDQYILDYSRIYKIPAVVFRQSCIYGPRQFGTEDQGWVAWFMIATLLDKKITIFGNGKQTRDLLYIDDLFDAWKLATNNIDKVKGEAFNIGGSEANSLSLLELIRLTEKMFNKKIDVNFNDWRAGDQKVFISNNEKLYKSLGWKPTTNIKVGLENLFKWITENKEVLSSLHNA